MTSTAKQILLIDDSEEDSFFVQRLLREFPLVESHSLATAENMDDGKKYLATHVRSISLVLLDLNLPDTTDGRDAYAQIRAINQFVPVIALTSVENRELAVDLMGMGLEDFVCKSDIMHAPQMLAKCIDFVLSHNAEKEISVRNLMEAIDGRGGFLKMFGEH